MPECPGKCRCCCCCGMLWSTTALLPYEWLLCSAVLYTLVRYWTLVPSPLYGHSDMLPLFWCVLKYYCFTVVAIFVLHSLVGTRRNNQYHCVHLVRHTRWNLFDRLFKAVILVVLPSTSDTPPNHGKFWR